MQAHGLRESGAIKPANGPRARILLADEDRLVRQGLRRLLEREADMEVVGEAAAFDQAIAMAAVDAPHVLLAGQLPGIDPATVTEWLSSTAPSMRVLTVSPQCRSRSLGRQARNSRPPLAQHGSYEALTLAVRDAVRGHNKAAGVPSGDPSKKLNETLNPMRSEEIISAVKLLTRRERDVLQLLAEGLSSKEIGQRLFIGVKTVETHRQRMMDKLDIHSVARLTKFAIRAGLTQL